MSALAAGVAADGIALDGRRPVPVALPADEQELLAVLERAAREGARVVPTGSGTKLPWCRPEVSKGAADLLLSTHRMDAVTEYVPGDGTLTAQAGCTLAQLAARVGAGGHRITPVVAAPERATLGGVLAAGISGPDRGRYGPARHHVLGLRVALADGRVARSGGRLVKNVTGFDLHRLYTGSRGTLAVLLEASLRLFPAPERVVALRVEAARGDELLARAERLRVAPIAPLALVVSGPRDGAWSLDVLLAGRAAQVEADLAQARERAGEVQELAGEAALARLDGLAADAGHPDSGWPQARLLTHPAHLAEPARAFAAELAPRGGRIVAQPEAGTIALFAPDLIAAPADWAARVVADWRARASELGARLEPLEVGAEVHRALAPAPDSRPELAWMEALRRRLDPEDRFRCPSYPTRS